MGTRKIFPYTEKNGEYLLYDYRLKDEQYENKFEQWRRENGNGHKKY